MQNLFRKQDEELFAIHPERRVVIHLPLLVCQPDLLSVPLFRDRRGSLVRDPASIRAAFESAGVGELLNENEEA